MGDEPIYKTEGFVPGWYDVVTIVTTRNWFQNRGQIDKHAAKVEFEIKLQFGQTATACPVEAIPVPDSNKDEAPDVEVLDWEEKDDEDEGAADGSPAGG